MVVKKIEPTNFNKWIIHQLYKIANNGMGQFMQFLRKNISYTMFVLMPVFGVLIFWFNRKKINYYIESLVLLIHFHSFVFLFFASVLLLESIINQPLIYLLWIIIPPVYMLLMFIKYFEKGFWITALKTFFVGVFYLISLIMFFLITVGVSVALV